MPQPPAAPPYDPDRNPEHAQLQTQLTGLFDKPQSDEQLQREREIPLLDKLRQAAPMLAGTAASLYPPLRTLKAATGIPAAVESVMQLVSGEALDPARAAMEGAFGAVGHGVGKAMELPGHFGRQQVRNVVTRRGMGPAAAERVTQTAIEQPTDLTAKQIRALIQKSVDLENASTAMRNGRLIVTNPKLYAEAQRIDELVDALQRVDTRGGGEIPILGGVMRQGGPSVRASGGGSGMFSPRNTLRMGRGLARTDPGLPMTTEGLVRGLLSILHYQMPQTPQTPDDER